MQAEKQAECNLYQIPQCAICQQDLSNDIVAVRCGHCFHGLCIRAQGEQLIHSCPLCRGPINKRDLLPLFLEFVSKQQLHRQFAQLFKQRKKDQVDQVLELRKTLSRQKEKITSFDIVFANLVQDWKKSKQAYNDLIYEHIEMKRDYCLIAYMHGQCYLNPSDDVRELDIFQEQIKDLQRKLILQDKVIHEVRSNIFNIKKEILHQMSKKEAEQSIWLKYMSPIQQICMPDSLELIKQYSKRMKSRLYTQVDFLHECLENKIQKIKNLENDNVVLRKDIWQISKALSQIDQGLQKVQDLRITNRFNTYEYITPSIRNIKGKLKEIAQEEPKEPKGPYFTFQHQQSQID